jgi:ankyrin repeat protein
MLFDAIQRGDAAAVSALLDAEPALLTAKQNGVSAILLAMYYGHAALPQLFIDRGAVLSIHEAAAVGDEAAVRRLLDHDPTLLDAFSDDGFPPLGLAIFFRHPALARMLIERGADVSAPARNAQKVAPLHAAAAVADRDTIALLLARGADPNARQQQDITPLHGSASRGDLDSAKLLVAAGADPHAKSADGKSAADYARERGFADFAVWLEGG